MLKQFRLCLAIGLIATSIGCSPKESPEGASSEAALSSENVSSYDAVSSANADESTDESPAEPATPPPIELVELPEPEGDEGGYSIAQVMQLTHKNRLYRELFSVPVDPAVAERVTLLYSGLPSQTPPKGDAESWQERSTALVESAGKVIAGDAESIPAFKKAVNCNSCHNRHR